MNVAGDPFVADDPSSAATSIAELFRSWFPRAANHGMQA
jgi:hypothetical protein